MKRTLLLILIVCAAALPARADVATVKVLSINNSLIDYNDQYQMFNNMASTMGKDATWTKHTNLGKTLAYHYNEDPLVPNAQEVVAGEAWTHIILQEQSSLPRTDYATFRSNVQTWVTYIRANCPNPDAVIILPINWAYSDDADFQTNNRTLIANFRSVAQEFGLTLCPVAIAYGNYRIDYPATIASDLYTDNRHPTQAASYLACCLEYAVIFGEAPSTITWKPDALAADKATLMRAYAQEAYEGTERTEPLPQPETPAISITGTDTYTQDFNSIGGEDVDPSTQEKTAYVRATTLPEGWRVENNTASARKVQSFASASETTMYIGGQSLASNAKNGTWNFGATGSTDRAVGGITSSIDGGARSVNVMAHLHNDAGTDYNTLTLSYDVEKYRNGANEAGFVVQLYTSTDGVNWSSAGSDFCTTFAKDGDTNGAAVVPIATNAVSGSVECVFPADGDLYLAWSISVAGGTDLAKSMALAIDNVSLALSNVVHVPSYAVLVTDNSMLTENFDGMGGSDADPSTDSKTGVARESTLPAGWKIDRNLNGPRQVGSYSSASETTMYIGGQSLASNAYNGTWNFGTTGSTDRALGGLTTGVDNGTRGLNIMVRLFNNSTDAFDKLSLAYDIEKYRNGSNSAGFTVQLYTSTDGVTWQSAGEDFCTSYAPDANTNGFATVPASVTQISKDLDVNFPVNGNLYLAWNISPSSGTNCASAPGYAIDNVSITPSASSVPTVIESIAAEQHTEWTKVLREGQLLLMRGNDMYSVQGVRMQ